MNDASVGSQIQNFLGCSTSEIRHVFLQAKVLLMDESRVEMAWGKKLSTIFLPA